MFDAKELIGEAIKRHGDRIAVSCSFGKDSIAILHMALRFDAKIKVVFANTGVEFPETIRYKNLLKRQWNLNLYETTPYKSFWQCAIDYKLPKIRKKGGKGSNAPHCCYYLKHGPTTELQKALGLNAIIMGLQAEESNSRLLLSMRYNNGKAPYMSKDFNGETIEFCSQRWYTRNTDMFTYNPIMQWTNKEVWRYLLSDNIPINEVYTKWGGIYKRCGCLPCTAYLDWKKKLTISHPKLATKLMNMQGQRTLTQERDFPINRIIDSNYIVLLSTHSKYSPQTPTKMTTKTIFPYGCGEGLIKD